MRRIEVFMDRQRLESVDRNREKIVFRREVIPATTLFDDGVESRVRIGAIFHRPQAPVRFDETVLTFDNIPISGLPLTLHVAGVVVFDSVVEVIV